MNSITPIFKAIFIRTFEVKTLLAQFFLITSLNLNAQTDSLSVVAFLSTTCPICQNQTWHLRKLQEKYKNQPIRFTAVFPGVEEAKMPELIAFINKYQLGLKLVADPDYQLTGEMKAAITPTLYLVEDNTQKVLYRGKLNNSFESVGKKRQVVTEHYLADAIEARLSGKKIMITETKPVGCIIEKPDNQRKR
jgi:peroxiredoxin